jgi:hypothetical protein
MVTKENQRFLLVYKVMNDILKLVLQNSIQNVKWRVNSCRYLMPGTHLLHATPPFAMQRRLTWVRITE